MLARQSRPIEKSSPDFVLMPLWQATQRSEVRNSGVEDEFPLPPRTHVAEAVTNDTNTMELQRIFRITSPR